ncbi:MAG: portal protein [Bryobacteraceae bacterium]
MAADTLFVSNAGTVSGDKLDLGDTPFGTSKPATAGAVMARFTRGAQIMRPMNRQYWINRSFLTGQQWIWWNQARNRVDQLPRDDRVRATMNILRGYHRQLVAKLLQRELVFECRPNDGDDESIRGAHIAEAILMHTARIRKWETLREHVAIQTLIGGTALLSLDWDTTAGQCLSMGSTTGLAYDQTDGKNVGTGDIVETVNCIAEVVTEPGSRDIETARWWIRATALPPMDVRTMFNMAKTPEADALTFLSPYEGRIMLMERGELPIQLTLVVQYYERPNPLCEKGMVASVVNGEFVSGPDPWPFPFKDRLNLICFRDEKQHDRWWGEPVLTSAVPIQTAYNASWSAIIEHMKLAGNARMLVPDGSLDVDQLNDSPDSVISYNREDGPPTYLSAPQMPSWWVQQPAMLDAVMQDILGIHDVTQGAAPANIESGVGLSILGEADQTPLAKVTKEMADGWSRFGSMVLEIYAAKVKETRRIALPRGPQGSAPAQSAWTGKDLGGQTLAKVSLEAIIPRSRAAMQAWATALWDRHIITDPALFAKIADLPTRDNFAEGLDPDLDKAQRENHDIVRGQIEVPVAFDNHQTHIAAHNDFRKSERYERMDINTRVVMDQHVKAHEVLAAEAVAGQTLRTNVNPNLASAPQAHEPPPLSHALPPPMAVPSAPSAMERAAAAAMHGAHPTDAHAVALAQLVAAARAQAQAPAGLPANLTTPTATPFGMSRLPNGPDDMTDTLKQETGYGPTV